MNHEQYRGFRGQGWRIAALCAAAAFSLQSEASELTFEQVFHQRGEPAALHYQAVYSSGGAEHRMEVWRDADRRVKRRTDDRVETYASHQPGDAEFDMSILDLKKRIHTKVSRTNLYRIGNFTDWFDLGHALRHPKGGYTLSAAMAPKDATKPLQSCSWYELKQDGRSSRICWSAQQHVPMLIAAQDGRVVWRITEIDRKPIPAKTFDIHDAGFVYNDANGDIEPD
ncbi:hypothetical protein [Noviherbaspirillum pedocola]|uniref:Uncharacterized protein n=1 Tax=Noviherbaspirillum pedocola TaxID=2801341 RepID=A0A934T3U9_9BURK|nr:hypothetical protein [Noviherbaspirillum pedocola]MBK4738188.1 hypothetical protein [Noviherbaspirillum pedocola]